MGKVVARFFLNGWVQQVDVEDNLISFWLCKSIFYWKGLTLLPVNIFFLVELP